MLRIPPFSPTMFESLVTQTIGCCIEVHRALGPGLNESVYSRACAVEFGFCGIPFETERSIPIGYREKLLCHQRVDLFVDGRLVLEVKSVDCLHPVHIAQTVSYLRLTGARVGLLVNFNVELLKQGIRRVVL
jgi:GxxExxY protein